MTRPHTGADRRPARLPAGRARSSRCTSATSPAPTSAAAARRASYFFKASSSLAASGGVVERPAGTELLAFEGEIALVIGEPARVTLADAWDHVAWVTAANDLGLYDLRANDKGSNVRSKGGDGYTPIGPHLIDARTVDPAALRVRTWVNGELRQDDTTAGLIFPLAQFVADLSQHFTLETRRRHPHRHTRRVLGHRARRRRRGRGGCPGIRRDVGTPRDDRRRRADVAFDETVGSLPRSTTRSAKRPGAPASGGPAASTRRLAPRDEPLGARLTSAAREARAGSGRGPQPAAAQARPQQRHDRRRAAAAPEQKLVGTAKTLRFVPGRATCSRATAAATTRRSARSTPSARARSSSSRPAARPDRARSATSSRSAHARGAAGIVTDGGVRDADAVAAVGIPVYTVGAHPAVLGRKHVPWDTTSRSPAAARRCSRATSSSATPTASS
jgi:hypothetical protein